jgi:hypothetical protein
MNMSCDWCKEEMDCEAIVCPTCNRERKDFHNLKMAMYFFLSVLMLVIFYGLFSNEWKSAFLNEFEIKRLFTTLSGWLAILTFIVSQVLYVKASRIVKTWWWY